MPSRLHTSTSALIHSLQDFIGLPRPIGPGMAILVIEFVQEDARETWPYHLRPLVLSETATSWIPYFVYRVSIGTSSYNLTLQIQQIMAQSFLRSLCKFGAVGAKFLSTGKYCINFDTLFVYPWENQINNTIYQLVPFLWPWGGYIV